MVDEAFPDGFDAAGIGASLREARLALRRDVIDVARELRIRHVYIEAIEDGRYDDLPGLAYQTGFLRAYGNYLGLDGAELAERLRSARDVTANQGDLQVFSPVDEGHLPTRSVLMLAVLLAIAVYGVWYFLANTEGDPVERVAALPDRFADLLDREPSAGVAAPDTAADAPTGATAANAPTGAPAADAPPIPQPTARAGDSGDGVGETTVAARTEPSAPVAEAGVETPDAAARPPEPQPPLADVAPDADADPTAADSSAEAMATVLAPSSVPPADAVIDAARDPDSGSAAAGTLPRLVLRAVTDAWVEIRAGNAPPVYSGLLREGESYAVPQRQGLTMVTGNAGGLEILVDGREMPRLGAPGTVMRGIDLDDLRRRESG